jgi:hypothetical protein
MNASIKERNILNLNDTQFAMIWKEGANKGLLVQTNGSPIILNRRQVVELHEGSSVLSEHLLGYVGKVSIVHLVAVEWEYVYDKTLS